MTIKFEAFKDPGDNYLEQMWGTLRDNHKVKVITLHFEKQKEKLRDKLMKERVLKLIK